MTTPDNVADLADVTDLAAQLGAHVHELADALLRISHEIHDHPELRFQEHHATALLQEFLTLEGFTVHAGIAGMPTAFRAERVFGADGPTIVAFCEYDALPGLGHACGHNLIAAAGAGAAAAAARWLAAQPAASGRLMVLGSPGEEGGGGKVRLIDDGQLNGVGAAVMVHPAGFNSVARTNPGRVALQVTFTGRASHAAAAPELGRNALDAATLLLVAIGLLRQQLRPDTRLHAVITDGGESVNVIPERSVVQLFIRSPDAAYLRGRLADAVRDCVQGAALATNTTAELLETAPAYEPVLPNPVLAALAASAYAAVGRPLDPALTGGPAGSTDMGNVSQVVPALHPYLQVLPGGAIHTREFLDAARSQVADQAVLDGATVLASMLGALLTREALFAAVGQSAPPRQED